MNKATIIPLLLVAAGGGYFAEDAIHAAPALLGRASCDIKGNISYNTGERIYHVRGQEHYDETRITTGKGERWFCTEDEARQAGWRKARR